MKKTIKLDKKAKSLSKKLPAFLAPPKGAKAYHGFPLEDNLSIEGFNYGSITNYLEIDSEEGCTSGDGYVEGPDGTRAGIAWEKGDKFSYSKMIGFEKDRWGVYYFKIPFGIKNLKDMKKAFLLMLPILKKYYSEK